MGQCPWYLLQEASRQSWLRTGRNESPTTHLQNALHGGGGPTHRNKAGIRKVEAGHASEWEGQDLALIF